MIFFLEDQHFQKSNVSDPKMVLKMFWGSLTPAFALIGPIVAGALFPFKNLSNISLKLNSNIKKNLQHVYLHFAVLEAGLST